MSHSISSQFLENMLFSYTWIRACSPPFGKTDIELVKPARSRGKESGEITDPCFNLSLPGLVWTMPKIRKETRQEKPSTAIALVTNLFPECFPRRFIRLKSTSTASL